MHYGCCPSPCAGTRRFFCLGIETGLLVLLLWLAARWSGAGWFPLPVLPGVLYGVAFAWGMALLIRYARLSGWLRAALCLGLGVALMLTINALLDRLAGPAVPGHLHGLGFQFDFFNWADPWVFNENVNAIVTLALGGAALACLTAGLVVSLRRRRK